MVVSPLFGLVGLQAVKNVIMTRRYINRAAIKKAASGEAAQYLFRRVGFRFVSVFIVFFIYREAV